MLIKYSSNNSGGSWWLKDEDWENLEKAGWKISWVRDETDGVLADMKKGGRWLGALAKYAEKDFPSVREAILEFEKITGQEASDEGCNCCGPPHGFDWGEGDDRNYASGDDIVAILYENVPESYREAVKRLNE